MRASEKTYRTLRDEILEGKLLPGTVLAEVEQSSRLRVSRTPIRQALSRLVADGLVAAQSPRMLVVTDMDTERVRSLYELRYALESHAAALAARRRDTAPFERIQRELIAAPELLVDSEDGLRRYFSIVDALDEAIDEAAENSYLSAALASVRLHSARIRRLSRHDADRLRNAAKEHLLVVEAILESDPELAAHATHIHLRNSLTSALARLETHTAVSSSQRT
ncbi:MAG TPA: GntR family transcriptional regulator [Candidatus Agrococcus pullicola]|uniref:GntR family transcriptional regulator n=1 Tax=Candidatus Agrococcus pullicola TaxID=2838429 RepID=A0A9D1Z0R2_9MICO|nr:GntR family transcriptional regulator [Candidatus Agrococcus pullicola]